MAPLWDLGENPLFMKHVRSRLRGQYVLPAVIVVGFLCICAVWFEWMIAANAPAGRSVPIAFYFIAFLQGILLTLTGTSQVASAIADARDRGILDFHRVSPVSAPVLTLGFLLGAPIREYLLYALTLPFALVSALLCDFGVLNVLKVITVQLTSALFFHSLGLVVGLLSKKGGKAGGSATGLVVLLNIMANVTTLWGVGGPALLTVVPVYQEAQAEFNQRWGLGAGVGGPAVGGGPGMPAPWRTPRLYGVAVPVFAQSLLFQSSLFLFLFIAASRKMRSDKMHPYSKPQAVAFLAVLLALGLGTIWDMPADAVLLGICYFGFAVAVLLIAAVTPSFGEYGAGLRRARKNNQIRPLPWEDAASNLGGTAVMASLVCVAAILAYLAPVRAAGIGPGGAAGLLQPESGIAVAVAAVALFGFARQFFELRFRRRGTAYFTLFLFLAWVAPLVMGSVLAAGGLMESAYMFAFSPLAGITLASLAANPGGPDPMFLALIAVGPTAALALLFLVAALMEQRKAETSAGQEVRQKVLEAVLVE